MEIPTNSYQFQPIPTKTSASNFIRLPLPLCVKKELLASKTQNPFESHLKSKRIFLKSKRIFKKSKRILSKKQKDLWPIRSPLHHPFQQGQVKKEVSVLASEHLERKGCHIFSTKKAAETYPVQTLKVFLARKITRKAPVSREKTYPKGTKNL